ncbi:hypothetical protein OG730_23585 [Streptomyces sp. NBC_01298]|uniref:hypothetical protein n=1 Tax=Streptomyces sp. NBC_01298 TaxID=2903817 RepID=UPI002E133756|nr:hypothetical protein OG730_23585 [Streptomyces sp. NBC_01298]
MRKALTLSAIALASSMALAAPAVAFAADSTPTAPVSSSPSPSPKTDAVALKLSVSSGKPGDSLQMSMEVPDGSTNLSISSKALNDVKMTDGRGATATIAKVADGSYGVSLTGTGPDGKKIQATAQLTVKDGKPTPPPTPTTSTVSLSKDSGKPGERIQVTIKTAPNEKSAFIKSDAFGGQVNLKSNGKGTWTGTAVVAKDVKSGYYGVEAYAGGKKFDTVKFSTDATGPVTPKPKPTPVDPSHHKTPKGSVNTGQAPLGWVPSDVANHG